ncbi:uncharacterized protein LOC144159572 [Haemaphysalis longicornis]
MNLLTCFPCSSPASMASTFSTQRTTKRKCFIAASFTHIALMLIVQAKPSYGSAPPFPSVSPTADSQAFFTTPVSTTFVTATSCSKDGCTQTSDRRTTSSADSATAIAITIRDNKLEDTQTVNGSSPAHGRPGADFTSTPNISDADERGNASQIEDSTAPPGSNPENGIPRTTEHPDQLRNGTTEESTTENPTVQRADASKTTKQPRRKLRKGHRKNNADRRNASSSPALPPSSSSSSVWMSPDPLLWEARDEHYLQTYVMGGVYSAVALGGLVGVGTLCGSVQPLLGSAWAVKVMTFVVTSAISRAASLLLVPEPPFKRILLAVSTASLFFALALFWLALCRPMLVRAVAANVMGVVLLLLPIVAEWQAGGPLVDAELLKLARLTSLAAACLGIFAALFAFPWLRRAALKSQDSLLCSALAKMQDDAAEVPRRLPRPLARSTLTVALVATLLCLVLAVTQGYAAYRTGEPAQPAWLWFIYALSSETAKCGAELSLAFAATRPAVLCHTSSATVATLLTTPCFATDTFGRPPGGTRSGGGDQGEAAALCDAQSPAKAGLLGHSTLQRTALLFHDQCVSSSVSTSRFCSAAGGSREVTSSDEDDDSHRALAGSTAPGTVDGSPWSHGHSSVNASFRRLGSSTCSSESAAHSFDLAWGAGGPLRPPQTLRLDLSVTHRTGGCGADASQDVTPDSAVYVDLSPDLRRSEGHSLDKLQNKNCPCCAARRPWRRAALQRYALSASRFSLSGYEPLRREDCHCCTVDHAVDSFLPVKSCTSREEWHRNLQSLPPPASSAF